MRTLYRILPILILLWTAVAAQTPGNAQEQPAPVTVVREQPFFDSAMMEFIKTFGLGGMIFAIWLFDYRRQRSNESIIEQYDKMAQAHLAAFKEINERNMTAFREAMSALQKTADDGQSTAIMCATVNTKVAERLDYLSKERAA